MLQKITWLAFLVSFIVTRCAINNICIKDLKVLLKKATVIIAFVGGYSISFCFPINQWIYFIPVSFRQINKLYNFLCLKRNIQIILISVTNSFPLNLNNPLVSRDWKICHLLVFSKCILIKSD